MDLGLILEVRQSKKETERPSSLKYPRGESDLSLGGLLRNDEAKAIAFSQSCFLIDTYRHSKTSYQRARMSSCGDQSSQDRVQPGQQISRLGGPVGVRGIKLQTIYTNGVDLGGRLHEISC
jgi:hypothetical protein